MALRMEDLKVKAVSEVPEQRFGAGRQANPLYGQLIENFLASKDKVFMVEIPEGKQASLVSGLKKFATEHASKVQISTRGKTAVYLSRSTTPFAAKGRGAPSRLKKSK